ncbi:hypothetical protein OAG66_01370 [bacterium]|nr:hypothetical protein [bacterium]
MKKQTTLKIANDDGTSETIPCHIQKKAIFKTRGMSYRGRKTIKGHGRKWFTSDEVDTEVASRDINEQCHHFMGKGKRSVIKVNTYPSLLKVVNAMLATEYEIAENAEDTRFTYASCLRTFTPHLPGKEPEWEWTDTSKTVRQFKEGSKWDKITVNELTPALIRKFRVAYLKGYTPKTMDYNIRARGCDSVLKSVKPIFSKHFTKNVYKDIHGFKMPDMAEFREMPKIPNIPPAQYVAPDEAMINKVLGSIDKLYEECLDTWLTFILSYAIGLRWSEIRFARYSWFSHEMVNDGKGGRAKRYYCNVQATPEWTPKACSLGKVTISKETYDMVLATKGFSRERLKATPAEIQELVWSKPSHHVAKQLGYSDVGLGKICSRLGIPKPPRGFWARVKAGEVPHPQGCLPEGVSSSINVITIEEAGNADERVLKRYNGHARCHSSANRRLKRWMKKHGWDRFRACHEMRAYNGAMVTTMTSSLYETQKRLRHRQSRTTEKSYADLVAHNTDAVSFIKAS